MSMGKGDDKKKSPLGVYNDLMIQYPFLMNGAQAGILGLLSNLTSQYISKGATTMDAVDWFSAFVFTFIPVAVMTPIALTW